MLETLVQAARKWIRSQDQAPKLPMIVTQVRNLRYAAMVRPGDTLRVRVTLRKREDDAFHFEGVGHNKDQLAVQGRFTLTPLDPTSFEPSA